MLKVIFPGSPEVISLSEEEAGKAFGIQYLPQLEFLNTKLQDKVTHRCAKGLKKETITIRQKWLGTYFSKELDAGYYCPDLIIRWVNPILGWGVFAEKDIPKGQYIGEYTGILRKRQKRADQKNDYCFDYSIGEGIESPYLIDAEKKGSICRFINHDARSNLEPHSVYWKGAMHMIMQASRLILEGEQLTYDYGEDYWSKRPDPQRIR